MKDEELQLLLKRAVSVVEGAQVPDELKSAAFAKAFDTLSGEASVDSTARPVRGPRKRARKSADAKGSKQRTAKASGPKSLISELIVEGQFDDWQALAQVQEILRVRGYTLRQPAISPALLRLTQEKALVREERAAADGRGKQWMYRKRGT